MMPSMRWLWMLEIKQGNFGSIMRAVAPRTWGSRTASLPKAGRNFLGGRICVLLQLAAHVIAPRKVAAD